jgi:putative tryptophan/tyrosine transport system substrate-binding protein
MLCPEVSGSAMRRRDFVKVIGAAAAWPLGARGQQLTRIRRVGVLIYRAAGLPTYAFEQRLRELGWTEGRNIQIDWPVRFPDPAYIRGSIAELLAPKPDVILAKDAPETKAVLEQTHTVPIVFVMCADPVGDGLVKSFARPGGNVTGFSSFEPGMGGKWVELLKEIAPNVNRVAAIAHPDEPKPSLAGFLRATELPARSLGVELTIVPDNPKASRSYSDSFIELERAIDDFARKPNGGLTVFPGTHTTSTYYLQSIWPAERYRLPAVYPFKPYVRAGGLVSYGFDAVDNFQRAASYVDRILRGEKPGDLPVQAPTKFELVINLKTAKALGLTVPPSLLARADEVID